MIVLLLRLYWEFFLVGLFSMGGGMATVPFLFDLSARTGWFTTADLTTMIAISEATPGPIGVNMATYVGYVSAGIPGSIIAPLGLVTPAVIIILLVSKILNTLWQNPKVKGLFTPCAPASVGLIGAAAFFCVRGLIVQHGTGPCSPLALYPAVRNHADCDESSQAERASLCLLHRSCRSGRYCFSNGGLNELR